MISSLVVRVFESALALPAAQREAFVRQACQSDSQALAEVNSLLSALDQAGAFLTAPDPATSRQALPHARPDLSGSKIGPYHLLELIGTGGFGSVYMAEQQAPLRRRVALKVLNPGMDSYQVLARFEQERQALALMDHPNIARVLDAGVAESGLPYFVMELVRGSTIIAYCDQAECTIAQRLELFTAVCQGIQHAHSKGVIHRDLKPGNVLVTLVDSRPVPKIIDFGIAKAISGPLTEMTLFTEHRQLIGTPEYMSPEQASSATQNIDTRSDVYALGVLLYELLTGVTPFDARRLRSAAWDEMQRIIREDDPPAPSTRLSGAASLLPHIAHSRGIDPRQLGPMVRGELDWIVMKCLEKSPTRRYDTASALAADIRRHIEGLPIEAAPPSRIYRITKFVRRNRGLVTAASAVGIALAGGLVGTSIGLLDARRHRIAAEISARNARDSADSASKEAARATAALAEAERSARFAREALDRESGARKAATEAAAEATSLMQFSDRLIGAANPDITHTAETSVRQMLDEAAAAAGEHFASQPGASFAIRFKLGRAYWAQRDFEAAICQLSEAEALVPLLPGLAPSDKLDFYWTYLNALWETNGSASARVYREFWAQAREVVEPISAEAWETVELMRETGIIWSTLDEGKAHAAAQQIEAAARMFGSLDAPEAQAMIRCLIIWGNQAGERRGVVQAPESYGRVALDCYDRALAMLLETRTDTNTDVTLVRERRIWTFRDMKDFRGMLMAARQWGQSSRKVLPADHWVQSLALCYEGVAEMRLGKPERAIELLPGTIGPLLAAPGLAQTGNRVRERIAEAMRLLGRDADARTWEVQAADWCLANGLEPATPAVLETALGSELRELAHAMTRYDRLFEDQSPELGEVLRRVIRIGRDRVKAGHRADRIICAWARRRDIALSMGLAIPGVTSTDTLELDRWVLELANRIPETSRETIGSLRYFIGFRLLFMADPQISPAQSLRQAEAEFREAWATLQSFDPSHPFIALCQMRLGHCLYVQGRYEEALAVLGDCIRPLRAESGAGSIYSALALRWKVSSALALDRVAEAREAISEHMEVPGADSMGPFYLAMMARAMLEGDHQTPPEQALAVHLAQRTVESQPGLPAGYSVLARALDACGRENESAVALGHAKAWRPPSTATPADINVAVWGLVKDRLVQPELASIAADLLAPVVNADPHAADIVNTLAVALYRAGRFAEATERGKQLLLSRRADGYSRDPTPGDYSILAMSLWRLGRSDEARRVLAEIPPGTLVPPLDDDDRHLFDEARRLISAAR